MKAVPTSLLAVALVSTCLVGMAAAQTAGVKVIVNGTSVPLAAPAVLRNGQVMAPISGLFEPMGAIAAYYEADRAIVVTNRMQTTIQLRLGDLAAVVNGRTRLLPAAPLFIGGHVFVPAQIIFQLLGAWTKYDDVEQTLHVSSQITAITAEPAGGALQVTVEATGPVQTDTNVLSNPDRLVVDFLHAALRTQEREYPIGLAGILRIRTGQFQVRPYISRMVFDLETPVEVRITTEPTSYRVVLEVRPKDAAGGEAREPPSAPGAGPVKIMGVAFAGNGHGGRVTVDASGQMEYRIREFVYPDRLAIDIHDAVFVPVKQEIAVDGTSIVAVRAAQFTAQPPVARVVVTLKRKLNYVVGQSGGQLILDLTTSAAAGHVVALDPGHGGRDPGAIGPTGLRESDVVLDIALRVRDLLTADGIRVAMIREADETVELQDRPGLARDAGATIYVSLHANASPRAVVNGTETYYLTPQSLALAQMIQDELSAVLGIPSRGIRTANFVVLRDSGIPSVLVETAFISHADDESRLREEAFRQQVASAVHKGVVRFLAVYPAPVAP